MRRSPRLYPYLYLQLKDRGMDSNADVDMDVVHQITTGTVSGIGAAVFSHGGGFES